MGTVTILEIGADPEVMVRYKELEQSIEEHKRNEEKVNNRLAMFNDKMLRGVKLSAEEMQYFRKLNKSLMLLNKQHYKEKDEFDVLSSQLGSYKSGSVRIEGPIFPGVKIVISGSVYQVNDEMYKNYFVRDAGDVYVRNI